MGHVAKTFQHQPPANFMKLILEKQRMLVVPESQADLVYLESVVGLHNTEGFRPKIEHSSSREMVSINGYENVVRQLIVSKEPVTL